MLNKHLPLLHQQPPPSSPQATSAPPAKECDSAPLRNIFSLCLENPTTHRRILLKFLFNWFKTFQNLFPFCLETPAIPKNLLIFSCLTRWWTGNTMVVPCQVPQPTSQVWWCLVVAQAVHLEKKNYFLPKCAGPCHRRKAEQQKRKRREARHTHVVICTNTFCNWNKAEAQDTHCDNKRRSLGRWCWWRLWACFT